MYPVVLINSSHAGTWRDGGLQAHGDFIVLAAWDVLGPNENHHFEGLVDDARI